MERTAWVAERRRRAEERFDYYWHLLTRKPAP
jgi:hypothetical protein